MILNNSRPSWWRLQRQAARRSRWLGCLVGLTSVLVLGPNRLHSAEENVANPFADFLRDSFLKYVQPLPAKMPGNDHDTPERIALGKRLFHDKNLSDNRTVACSSCHALDRGRGGADQETTSPGSQGRRGARNTPTVFNAGFYLAQFWDGRASNLTAQAKGPILNPVEMAMPSEAAVVARVQEDASYPPQFRAAFPGVEPAVSFDHVAEAIAAFERTLITRDRLDAFFRGNNRALSEQELRGLDKFMTYGCKECHSGVAIGGESFQRLGLLRPYTNSTDVGRQVLTRDPEDAFKFKVPSLRNIALTPPYFHDGSIKSLDEAVRKMAFHQIGLELSDPEVADIVSFLHSCSDTNQVAAGSSPKN
jgi:cytochrome c peroxidase